jgi:hypothetical protein
MSEVFRLYLSQFDTSKYYEHYLKTRSDMTSSNKKYYSTNPLQYLGKFVDYQEYGHGDNHTAFLTFNDNGKINTIFLDYEGNSCFREVPCKQVLTIQPFSGFSKEFLEKCNKLFKKDSPEERIITEINKGKTLAESFNIYLFEVGAEFNPFTDAAGCLINAYISMIRNKENPFSSSEIKLLRRRSGIIMSKFDRETEDTNIITVRDIISEYHHSDIFEKWF